MLFDLETQNVPTATRKQLNLQAAVLIFTILAVAAQASAMTQTPRARLETAGLSAATEFRCADEGCDPVIFDEAFLIRLFVLRTLS
jgi:hypothetical protein